MSKRSLVAQAASEPLVCRFREPAVTPDWFTSMAPMSPPRVIVVIVVEDEIMIRLPVVSALEAADFEVIEAGHAGEALAILEREAVRVHVVFTDAHARPDGRIDAGASRPPALAQSAYWWRRDAATWMQGRCRKGAGSSQSPTISITWCTTFASLGRRSISATPFVAAAGQPKKTGSG